MKTGSRTDEHKSVFGNRHKDNSGTASRANWATADPKLIQKLVVGASSRGGAVRFGYTRDGGAYAVGLYYGTEHVTEYCRPTEDLNVFLADQIDFYNALPDSNGKSPAQ